MGKNIEWVKKHYKWIALLVTIIGSPSAYFGLSNTYDNSQHNNSFYNLGANIVNSQGFKYNQTVNYYGNTNSNTSGNNAAELLDRSELMEMYEDNGPYYLKLSCGTNLANSTNNNSVQLWLSPLMYNGKGYPTSIPFYVSDFYEFDGIQADFNTVALYFNGNNPEPLIDPKPRIERWSIDLTQPLEKASQRGITKVRTIMLEITFAPFDTTDQKFIAEYPPANITRVTLAEFNLVNGNWNMGGDNTICSQNLPLKLKS